MSAYSDKVIADGCSAYWRLGELSGTTAVDVVGGFNGIITGNMINMLTLDDLRVLRDGLADQIHEHGVDPTDPEDMPKQRAVLAKVDALLANRRGEHCLMCGAEVA